MSDTKSSQAAGVGPPAHEPAVTLEDDSDPDIDELDDVLDQFSANISTTQKQVQPLPVQPTPSASGPGRPSEPEAPIGKLPSESQDDFMARLTKEMELVIGQMSAEPGAAGVNPDDMAMVAKQLGDFSMKMEEQGVKPEDILKAIMGEQVGEEIAEAAHDEHDRRESESDDKPAKPIASKSTFDEQIRKTMERIGTSDSKATEATQKSASTEEDMLAELLRAMEAEGGGEGEGDLSKMFLGMMEQLTHKDMLYEPMKTLDDKYPDWLAKNKSKLKPADAKRYTNQQAIVKEIVGKFEERGYSDDDPKCRDYIWERMQKMQEEGAPPEELIDNPLPGMGGMPGLGGDGEDPGCPTQ